MEQSTIHPRAHRPHSQRPGDGRCCGQGEGPVALGGVCPLHPGEGLCPGVSHVPLPLGLGTVRSETKLPTLAVNREQMEQESQFQISPQNCG